MRLTHKVYLETINTPKKQYSLIVRVHESGATGYSVEITGKGEGNGVFYFAEMREGLTYIEGCIKEETANSRPLDDAVITPS